jgi:hypothetical protein
MQNKTKMSIRKLFAITLTGCLATSVLLLSVHAKDLAAHADVQTSLDKVEKVKLKDVSEKATAELHNHVSKQVVKTFDNSSGDQSYTMSARGRDDLDIHNEGDPGLWGYVHETWLMWRALATLPFTH